MILRAPPAGMAEYVSPVPTVRMLPSRLSFSLLAELLSLTSGQATGPCYEMSSQSCHPQNVRALAKQRGRGVQGASAAASSIVLRVKHRRALM